MQIFMGLYSNGKPKFFLIELIKGIIDLIRKKNEKDDWWKKHYKNHYD
jgi:hypothetical protein